MSLLVEITVGVVSALVAMGLFVSTRTGRRD